MVDLFSNLPLKNSIAASKAIDKILYYYFDPKADVHSLGQIEVHICILREMVITGNNKVVNTLMENSIKR